jgi:hypothetical protein
MRDIPRSALMLGLAGLIPFLWGAATLFSWTRWRSGASAPSGRGSPGPS